MTRRSIYTAILAGLMASPLVVAAPAAVVSNNNNSGPGSLRAALGSGATVISIKGSVGDIAVTESLDYAGTSPLKILGSGQTIDGSGLSDKTTPILLISNGADVSISNLAFDGGGGYDFDNQGGGKGIFVDVPIGRTGVVTVRLNHVSVFGTGNHGVHISDCTLGDDCGSGGGGGGNGSPASIDVQLVDVLIDGAGWGKADADGFRVDERADGSIFFSATNSTFINVGADGVELDEGNDGDVILDVRNNLFEMNGEFCLGDDPEDLSEACDDDGEPDVDDGFDVDEAGDGSVLGLVRNNDVIDNFDEGLDFDEEDEGGFDVVFASNYASGNEDEGVKLSESGPGDNHATFRSHVSEGNNGSKAGVRVEEEDAGEVAVVVTGSTFVDPDNEELRINEDGDGGTLKVRGTIVVTDLDPSVVEI